MDFQQKLKSIDDEIGYKSPSTLVIDSNFCFGMANSNCSVPLKSEFHAKQKSGQSKPIPEAQDKTLSHPTNWPTLEVKSTCLFAPTEKIEAINNDPKGLREKWKRVIRSPKLGNQEVIMSNAASRREQAETEDLRPTKQQALDVKDVYPLPTTVVAVDRLRRIQ